MAATYQGRGPSLPQPQHLPDMEPWRGPGVFVRMEFGVSFSRSATRNLSFGYESRRSGIPSALVPGYQSGHRQDPHRRRSQSASQLGRTPLPQQTQLRIELPQRGQPWPSRQQENYLPEWALRNPEYYAPHGYYYGPPIMQAPQTSSAPAQQQYNNNLNMLRPTYIPYSQPLHSSSYPPVRRPSVIDRKPLPATPSRYRLGEAGLPWSSPMSPWASPAWIASPDDEDAEHSTIYSEPNSSPSKPVGTAWPLSEDPQKTRDLAALHLAMMSIDTMPPSDIWEPWDAMGELAHLPRGPRSIGWAVRVEPPREQHAEYHGSTHTMDSNDDMGEGAMSTSDTPGHGGHGRGSTLSGISAMSSPRANAAPSEWERQWEYEERMGYFGRGDMRRRSSTAT